MGNETYREYILLAILSQFIFIQKWDVFEIEYIFLRTIGKNKKS